MLRILLTSLLVLVSVLTRARVNWAQAQAAGDLGVYDPSAASFGADLGNLGALGGGLNPGMQGADMGMPGAIPVKIKGEIQCVACTLEEMGLDQEPGNLYQFSKDNTHMVIKVTSAAPDIAWEMVEQHKLFLRPGEDATQLQRLLDEGKAGKSVEVTGGVAPGTGNFIPIKVEVR